MTYRETVQREYERYIHIKVPPSRNFGYFESNDTDGILDGWPTTGGVSEVPLNSTLRYWLIRYRKKGYCTYLCISLIRVLFEPGKVQTFGQGSVKNGGGGAIELSLFVNKVVDLPVLPLYTVKIRHHP